MVLRKLLTITSIMLLIVLYFWGHNSGTSNEILQSGILHTAIITADIGLVCLLLGIAGGIGRRLLSKVDFEGISIGEQIVIDSTIGLGIISLISVTLGLLGQYNWMIWGIVILLAMASYKQIFAWLGDVASLIFRSGRPITPWERFVRIFVAVTLLSALLLALAPPYAWDAINYHLVVPQRYLEAGSIGQHLDNHFFGFPQNMEMLYGLLMMVGSDRTPAVLHFMLGLLSLIAIYNLVQRHSSSKAGAVSVLVLMASFNIWQLFGWAYVDLSLMTYGIVAVIAIQQWAEVSENKQDWLIITAILASIAGGIKYTAAPLMIALYLLVILREPKNVIRNTLIFGGFGVLLFSPWLIKGLLLYENPVYPYIFDSVNWDDVRSVNFGETGKGLLGTGLGWHIPILPFTATIFGLDKVTPYRFTTGVFLLTLPFTLIVGWSDGEKNLLPEKAKQLAKNVIPLAIVVLIFWMLVASLTGIGGQTRLMIIGLPLASVLCGLAYHSIEKWQKRPLDMVFIIQATMIVSIFFGIFDYLTYFANSNVLAYHASIIDEDSYLQRNMGVLYDAMLELETLPDNSRVLFLWEPKTYYCPDTLVCEGDLLFDNWSRPLQMGLTPDELIAQWQTDYDYVLFFDLTIDNRSDGFSLWRRLHEFSLAENNIFEENFFPAVNNIWSDNIAYTLYTWRE
ncbi:MAG: hypothetical protein Phog2KO_10680 [Phototrophicaceae bacterium]